MIYRRTIAPPHGAFVRAQQADHPAAMAPLQGVAGIGRRPPARPALDLKGGMRCSLRLAQGMEGAVITGTKVGVMSDTYLGACLCGDVRFEIRGAFEHFLLCHCGRCRKDTGSAHAANLFSATARIEWLSGEDRVAEYVVPGTRHAKRFCRRCGAAVPGVQMNGALLVVPAGSLDSAIEMRPDAHICVSSRADWDRALHDIPEIDGLPT